MYILLTSCVHLVTETILYCFIVFLSEMLQNNKMTERFILIPLGALRLLFLHPDTWLNLFYMGVLFSAMRRVADPYIVKDFFANDFDMVKSLLSKRMARHAEILDKEYYPRFESRYQAVCAYEKAEESFAADLTRFYQVYSFLEYVCLNMDLLPVILNYADSDRSYDRYKDDPFSIISLGMATKLVNVRCKMSEDDRAALALHLGICSKIGYKTYAETTAIELKCRMFGCTTAKQLDEVLAGSLELAECYKKYATRRHYEHLMSIVMERYNLREFGARRRTYVSYKFMSDQRFIQVVAKDKKAADGGRRKKAQKELVEKYFGEEE